MGPQEVVSGALPLITLEAVMIPGRVYDSCFPARSTVVIVPF